MLKIHPSSRTFGSRESTADRTLPKTKIRNLQIKKSRCNQFIPNERGICGCGLLKEEHEIDTKSQEQPKWDPITCTIEDSDTDAFGTIRFNNNKDTVSKFIRVGQNTRMDQMTQVLFNCWKLQKPKLLISVTGGAQNFGLKSKLKDVFRKGLVKAAQSTNAWISTGGMNAGVMKHVGEAISSASLNPKQKIVVLGISNWCTVKNKNTLIKKHPDLENELFEYSTNPQQLASSTSSSEVGKSSLLDPNHSHFVLVDNAQLNTYGGEIDFRGRLEKAIVNYERDVDLGESIAAGNETPIVVLVLEGGPNTLSTVLSSVKNGSPCVFIEGSGKCADLFAFALSKLTNRDESSKTESLKKLDETLRAEISEKIVHYFNKPPAPILKSFEEILEYPHLLSVYRLSYDELGNDIDIAILRSLLKAKQDKFKAQLKLCLTWNRIDIAKNFIFTDDKFWNSEYLNDLFYMAIKHDRVDFVEIFLENGCDPTQFLTVRKLIRLYNDISKHSVLYNMLFRNKRNKNKDYSYSQDSFVFKLKEVGEVIEELLSGLYKHQFTKRPIEQINTNKTIQILEQTDEYGNRNIMSMLPSPSNTDISNNIDHICDYSEHELFMYCVLTGKAEMAKLFWKSGTNKICSALVASKIFKSYDEHYNEEENIYKKLSIDFENMALEVLQKCAEDNQDAAQLMLLRPIPEFGNATALQIAYTAGDKNFLSSKSYQDLLVKLWYGQIDVDSSTMNILLAVFLPVFSPLIIGLESDKSKLNLEAMQREAEDNSDKKEVKKDIEMNSLDSELEVESEIKVKKMSYLSKVYYFFRAPYVKFIYNQISFLLFLLLLSYVMLCEFYPIKQLNEDGYEIGEDIKIPEFILIGWVTVFLLDEIRFIIFANTETNLSGLKIGEYFGDFWNWVKFASILLFFVGIGLRLVPNYDCYLAARIILCIDVLFWFFRSLHSYSFIRSLGPKLVMIRRMINELMYFILIVLVFIFAYGVATQALMYHNQELDLSLIKNVFFPAYFVIGGEYFEREKLMEVDECSASNFSELALTDRYTQDDCPEQNGANVSLGLLVFYLIMLNILLVNLLIAIFSNTYEEVQGEADKIWKYQRYALVYEFYYRPFLATPFTVFYYIFEVIRLVVRWLLSFCIKIHRQDNSIALLSSIKQERLRSLEDFIADEYIRKDESRSRDSMEYKIQANIEKLELINNRLDEMNESRQDMSNRISELHDKIDKLLIALGGSKKSQQPSTTTIMTSPSTSTVTDTRKSAATHSVDTSASKDMALTRTQPLSSAPPPERALYSESTSVYKSSVPESKKSWDIKFADYSPTVYTNVQVLNSDLADSDILSMPIDTRPFINFNSFDDINGLDRRSCLGDYAVLDCLPLNPLGRTGIAGRGSLPYWGPNQVYEIAFTRFKRNSSGEIIVEDGKRQVEFIIVKNKNDEWSFPTVAQRKNAVFHDLVQKEIVDQLFQVNREDHREMLTLLKNPIIISKYCKNSEVNTDNAWQEYVLVNFHDQNNKILSKVNFKNGRVEWKKIDASLFDVKGKDAINLNLRKFYKHFFL